MTINCYETKPDHFVADAEGAGCYVEVDGKILLLQRASHKQEAGKWGVPAGKLETNERPEDAAKRELFEETGIIINSDLSSLGTLYYETPGMDYIYHLFKIKVDKMPNVILSEESQDYAWVPFEEIEKRDLRPGALKALKKYSRVALKKPRAGSTTVSAYLILRKQNEVLFHLRKNTGYGDGYFGLIAGHVEDGESATDALIREAFEEGGIEIKPSDLKVIHVAHRKTDRQNVDIFFEAKSYQGTLYNREPEKCERLEYFPLNCLPSNTLEYLLEVLQAISKGEFYSEQGW